MPSRLKRLTRSCCSCWRSRDSGSSDSNDSEEEGSADRRSRRRRRSQNEEVLNEWIGGDDHGVEIVLPIPPGASREANAKHRRRRDAIDELVLQMLVIIRTLADNDQEPPPSMLRLHAIAETENGWLAVVVSMVEVIPMEDPLGPANITLLLDDCPLPSKETVEQLIDVLQLSAGSSVEGRSKPNRHRNIAIVLGCLAEKLAGPRSMRLFSRRTLDYLVANLSPSVHPAVILFSLVALEKFAQTSENKVTIQERFSEIPSHPLLNLEKEKLLNSRNCLERQVGFCAQWCLDNLFYVDDRPYSYLEENVQDLRVMLNSNDVSEYLKIGPNGLEARCDAVSFESVRCTFEVSSGAWYYEVEMITAGIMQIGWATKDSKFLNHEGHGIGDDKTSVAFDGCRQLLWYGASSSSLAAEIPRWRPGDIVGALLDFGRSEVVFSLNGQAIKPFKEIFRARSRRVAEGSNSRPPGGFFAAASFMSFQQCRFNFGSRPFKYPPPSSRGPFQAFNAHGKLTAEEKKILPRQVKLEMLKRDSVKDDSCTLCFDRRACVSLRPCNHRGFCWSCAKQLGQCPMCRAQICTIDDDKGEEGGEIE